MKLSTIGELIEYLQKFPPETKILKGDPFGSVYYNITVVPDMTFNAKPVSYIDDIDSEIFVDAGRADRIEIGPVIEAVIL